MKIRLVKGNHAKIRKWDSGIGALGNVIREEKR
jgi:hypothetical protein